jgi:hypothetical protein
VLAIGVVLFHSLGGVLGNILGRRGSVQQVAGSERSVSTRGGDSRMVNSQVA